MKKRASHPDKEITNGEERRSRSRDVQKRMVTKKRRKGRKKRAYKKKEEKKGERGRREFQKPKKSIDRSCRLRSAPAIVRLVFQSTSERTRPTPFSFTCVHAARGWNVLSVLARAVARSVFTVHVALREVALSDTRAVPLSFSLINAITINDPR